MDALLTLEPRVAGEETVEPAIDFADHRDDLHMQCECAVRSHFVTDPTTVCLIETHECTIP